MEIQNRFCVIFDKGIEMICEMAPVALCANVFEHKRVSSVISHTQIMKIAQANVLFTFTHTYRCSLLP